MKLINNLSEHVIFIFFVFHDCFAMQILTFFVYSFSLRIVYLWLNKCFLFKCKILNLEINNDDIKYVICSRSRTRTFSQSRSRSRSRVIVIVVVTVTQFTTHNSHSQRHKCHADATCNRSIAFIRRIYTL